MFRRNHFILFSVLIIITLFMVGCSDDDDPVTPDSSSVGSIAVNPSPDILNAPWVLMGPDSYSKSSNGDQALNELSVGEYTLAWGDVTDYVTPSISTQTLVADGTITFNGIYVEVGEDTGTIVIDQTPDDLAGAGWSLAGPQNETGSGDVTLPDMPAGAYTLTWNAVDGYTTPSPDTQTMAEDTVAFSGTYNLESNPIDGFILLPAARFSMGSPLSELGRGEDESQHDVILTTPFHMSVTEITNEQFRELAQWALDNNYCTASSDSLSLVDLFDGSREELLDMENYVCEISFSGGSLAVDHSKEDYPARCVTWFGAVAYCDWLSIREGLPRAYDHGTWQCNDNGPYSAQGYRLPTEAEWEYACRAGSTTAFANGEITDRSCDDPLLDLIGWYCGNAYGFSELGPLPVGQLIPNSWGLYDMHGNLWEWCNDWYGAYDGTATDPTGPASGTERIIRGGYFDEPASSSRSANRADQFPDSYGSSRCFRPVKSAN